MEQENCGRICAKACKLALLEFERIGYQIRADADVMRMIGLAVFMYETKFGKLADVPDVSERERLVPKTD